MQGLTRNAINIVATNQNQTRRTGWVGGEIENTIFEYCDVEQCKITVNKDSCLFSRFWTEILYERKDKTAYVDKLPLKFANNV